MAAKQKTATKFQSHKIPLPMKGNSRWKVDSSTTLTQLPKQPEEHGDPGRKIAEIEPEQPKKMFGLAAIVAAPPPKPPVVEPFVVKKIHNWAESDSESD